MSPEFKEKFLEELKLSGESWAKEIDNIWAFGPRRVGPNILLNHIPEFSQTEYHNFILFYFSSLSDIFTSFFFFFFMYYLFYCLFYQKQDISDPCSQN